MYSKILLGLAASSLFFLLDTSPASAQTNPNSKKIEVSENVDQLKKALMDIRNECIYASIRNCKKNIIPVPIDYGKFGEVLKTYSQKFDFALSKSLGFDAATQMLILGDIDMKIEVPTFIYTYHSLLGDIDIEVSNFVFKNFRYDADEDVFFFKADFTYECKNGEILDEVLKSLGLESFLREIPFAKKNVIRLLQLVTENEASIKEAGKKTLNTVYDMQNSDGSHITNINVRIEF